MIIYDERNWLSILFHVTRGTDIWYTLPPALLSGGLGCLAWWLYQEYAYSFQSTAHTVAGTIISFLIVFRVNQAFSRFSEAAQLLMSLYKAARDLVSQFCFYSEGTGAEQFRKDLAKYTSAVVTLQLESLKRPGNEHSRLKEVLSPQDVIRVQKMDSHPLAVVCLIRALVFKANNEKVYPDRFVAAIEANIQGILLALANLDKIRNFPYPFPFAQVTLIFLFVWTTTLPFPLATGLGWITPLASFFVSFCFWSINDIGIILEDPFGEDAHDLPLSEIAMVVERDLFDVVALAEMTESELKLESSHPNDTHSLKFFGVAMPHLASTRMLRRKNRAELAKDDRRPASLPGSLSDVSLRANPENSFTVASPKRFTQMLEHEVDIPHAVKTEE